MTPKRKKEDTVVEQFFAPFEPLSVPRAMLGESPVWSDVHNAIWWIDISGCQLFRTTLNGQTESWDTPEIPGFVQCPDGEVMVGMQSGIFSFEPATTRFDRMVGLVAPGHRFNDACTDAIGRIWAGSMDLDNKKDNGVLYLFDPDQRTLTPKLDGFRTVNGLAWDTANNRLFVSDSHVSVQTVWTAQIDAQDQIQDRDVFARFHDLAGRPDGAALDPSGRYWIAGVGGGELYRFSAKGELTATYCVPQQSPTKPALVGMNGAAMALTSFEDDKGGGRLAIWRNPPLKPTQERQDHD